MKLEYYIIRGRGENGLKFQLAKLQDETGNVYKDQYDMSRQFSDLNELYDYIAQDVIKQPLENIEFAAMGI